jgi:SAM-dependent methyltransferase
MSLARRTLAQKLRRIPEHLRALVLRFAAEVLGLPVSLGTPDRRVLEGQILPWLAAEPWIASVLFVGCDWYTVHYGRMFAAKEYWTIEMDPARARYGASGRHVVGPLQDLDRRFGPDRFGAIVCNGVLGWGLNDREEAERAFAACVSCLAPGGLLVLGINDVPEKRVYPLAESRPLAQLAPFHFPPFGGASFLVPDSSNRHTFVFLQKA